MTMGFGMVPQPSSPGGCGSRFGDGETESESSYSSPSRVGVSGNMRSGGRAAAAAAPMCKRGESADDDATAGIAMPDAIDVEEGDVHMALADAASPNSSADMALSEAGLAPLSRSNGIFPC